jgi:hypothetical protein
MGRVFDIPVFPAMLPEYDEPLFTELEALVGRAFDAEHGERPVGDRPLSRARAGRGGPTRVG